MGDANRIQQWGIPLIVLGAFFLVTSFFLLVHTPDQAENVGGLPLECGSLIKPGKQASNMNCNDSLNRHRPRAIAFGALGVVAAAGGILMRRRTRRGERAPA